jgi:hypothetical protein
MEKGEHFSHSKTVICLVNLYIYEEARTIFLDKQFSASV